MLQRRLNLDNSEFSGIIIRGFNFKIRLTMNILNKIYIDYPDWNEGIAGKVLLITSSGRIKSDFFKKHLSKYDFVTVEAEPKIESVDDLYEKLIEENIDSIVAYGGGSVIDVAKILSASLFNKRIPSSLLENFNVSHRLSLFIVPTTFGSGSEATSIGVYKKEGKKTSIKNDLLIPDKVFLFSQVFMDISANNSKVFVADAFCHAIESFYSKNADFVSKSLSVLSIRLICENLSFKNKLLLSFSSLVAGIAENIAGVASIHALAYPLQNKLNLPHAMANSIILGYAESGLLLGDKNFSELKKYGLDARDIKKAIARLKSSMPKKLSNISSEIMAEDCASYSKIISNCRINLKKNFLVTFYEKLK